MSNTFSVYVKENGTYKSIHDTANAVFPLTVSNLLDEQLDEARLIIKNSSIPIYKTLTEMRIDLEHDSTVKKSLYMIVANDKATEYPGIKTLKGERVYKHDLYLIERTKLLEGVYCQSLTFTNILKKDTSKAPTSALSYFNYSSNAANVAPKIQENIREKYTTPIKLNSNIDIISCEQIWTEEINSINSLKSHWLVDSAEDTYIQIYKNETLINTLLYNESMQITLDSTYSIVYKITFTDNSHPIFFRTVDFQYIIEPYFGQYPTKPWTVKDCINRVLELAEPLYKGDTPRYSLNPIQAEKYDKITAPEFTMTQCTLREQLKIIGGYIHAEPRLGWLNPTTNEYEENTIAFDEYGTIESAEIGSKPYIYNELSQDINQYCTDVQTSAKNIVNSLSYAQGVVFQPNSNGYNTVRTDNVNVKLTESTSKVRSQLPIYKIIDLKCGVYKEDGTWDIEPVSINPYVFEAYEYNSLLSSYGGAYPYSKSYAIYYTQGERDISGLFFKPDNNSFDDTNYLNNYTIVNILAAVTKRAVKDIKTLIASSFPLLAFQISYIPVYDTKFSHGKQFISSDDKPFSSIYNQSENLIETRYYGENIKGVAQRLGNVEQTRTYMLSNIADIPKAGQIIDGYYISAVNYEFMPFNIKCTVALTKDFNRISEYVGINSNKRIAEISEREAYKREILLKEYVVFSRKSLTQNLGVFRDISAIADIFSTVSTAKPISAVISKSRNNYSSNKFGGVVLPVVSSAFGNAMVFTWNYKDNYSAGEQTQKINDAYWQTDITYCDNYGRIYWYDFGLYNDLQVSGKQALTCEYIGNPPANKTFSTFTSITGLNSDKPYKCRKDSREALSFNFEMEFVTTENDLTIGSALPRNCPLVTTETHSAPKVYFFNTQIGKFDNIIDTDKAIADASLTINSFGTDGNITFSIPNINFKSWAIVTSKIIGEKQLYTNEDGKTVEFEQTYGSEILLSSNKSKSDYGTETLEIIYFTPQKDIYIKD